MSIIKKAQSYKEKENTIIKREKPIFPQTTEGRFFSLFAGMKHFEEKAYLCALNRIFGFKPKIALALISHFGSASEVFSLKDKDLEMVLGPYSGYGTNFRLASVENEAKELDKLAKENIYFVGWTEESYPGLLKQCEDAPVGLYIRSRTPADELFKPRREIAMVGTRDISLYGKEWSEKTVKALSKTSERPRIISGLAFGADICAHRAAIENGLETIAVMATGPEYIYPYRHKEFALRLSETPGCALVTDYPPGTAPLALHFLRRNRIIAGLSEALLLMESKIKGGGMMTSRLAFSYSRDVYALPGRVDDIRSQGCNYLIKNKIAEPIISVSELIKSLGLSETDKHRTENWKNDLGKTYSGRVSEDRITMMASMLLAIRQERGISLDDLCIRCGMEYGQVATLAGVLETDGFISIDLLQRCCILSRK
jgi:DNA processing protein